MLCAASVARGEKTSCRAVAVTPGLVAGAGVIHALLETDVTTRSLWSSSNPSVATVNQLGKPLAAAETILLTVTGSDVPPNPWEGSLRVLTTYALD